MLVAVTIQRAVDPFKIHVYTCTHAHTLSHTHTRRPYSTQKWNGFPFSCYFVSQVFQHACMYMYTHSFTHIHLHTTCKANGLPSRYVTLYLECFSVHARTCTYIYSHTHTSTIHIPLGRGMDFLLGKFFFHI